MKRVLLYHTFIVEMERVLACQKVPSTCQRLPRMVTYYPGTMYRRTIDVGACEGLCRDKMACKATRITTVALSTPNGKSLLLNLFWNGAWCIRNFSASLICMKKAHPKWIEPILKLCWSIFCFFQQYKSVFDQNGVKLDENCCFTSQSS